MILTPVLVAVVLLYFTKSIIQQSKYHHLLVLQLNVSPVFILS